MLLVLPHLDQRKACDEGPVTQAHSLTAEVERSIAMLVGCIYRDANIQDLPAELAL